MIEVHIRILFISLFEISKKENKFILIKKKVQKTCNSFTISMILKDENLDN